MRFWVQFRVNTPFWGQKDFFKNLFPTFGYLLVVLNNIAKFQKNP